MDQSTKKPLATIAMMCGLGIVMGWAWKTPSLTMAQTTSTKTHPFTPLLARYCGECHGGPKPKGDFDLKSLNGALLNQQNAGRWQKVREHLQAGTMPPKGKARPTATELSPLLAWIGEQSGTKTRQPGQGRTVYRRLNRLEYENTLRDLLGIDLDLQDLLPPDSSANGFDNVGEALHTSSFLMGRYLEAADKALDLAIANGPQPPVIKKRYSLTETHQVKSTTEKVFRKNDAEVVCFASSAWQAVSLSPFYPPDRGRYRFRISTSAFQSDKPVVYRVDAGLMLMTGKPHLVGYFDAVAGTPGVVEFIEHLEPRSTIRILPYGLASAQAVHKVGAADYTGPGLAVQWVEVEGPLHDSWPPASHRRIFGTLPQEKAPQINFRNRVEVTSGSAEIDSERILTDFARRAFRRPVSSREIEPYLDLARKKRSENATFEQSLRVGLKAMLVSPEFLFLNEKPGPLDDYALASRLSYFLWSTMPDEELLLLAGRKELNDPATLRRQVERMLRDPRANSFTRNFAGQWLGLREIDSTVPSHILYPDYDDMLKASMLMETQKFFEEMIRADLDIGNFVDSQFTFLNGRLARHYGIPGVEGWEFKKVTLPPDSHRGGLLTMASVLKVTANGTYTSPILRGAWILERILGTPPPRPPEGVSAIEPDIRGATTIRKQLARHREVESCATCHVKIDPPGFALENFDVIGGWREYYRTSGNGKPVTIEGRRMHYLQGPMVDAGDVLEDGQKFKSIDEYKRLLLREKEQIARALIERLLTYGTGATCTESDRQKIGAILKQTQAHQFGFQSMIKDVVASDLFRNN